jgi:hypothetical protein
MQLCEASLQGKAGVLLLVERAVLTNWELWACANFYLKKHLDDAPIIAAMGADELQEQGDLDGAKN